jgi:hypothetical protein
MYSPFIQPYLVAFVLLVEIHPISWLLQLLQVNHLRSAVAPACPVACHFQAFRRPWDYHWQLRRYLGSS